MKQLTGLAGVLYESMLNQFMGLENVFTSACIGG